MVAVAVHPLASVTVTVYVPAVRPVALALVPPEGAQLYEYAGVPPPAVAVALPVFPPKQRTGVMVAETVSNVGCVIVTVAVLVHPLASVTVTVYVPAVKPVAAALVPPEGVQL